jgi:glycolate oxidase FAD binding subunit
VNSASSVPLGGGQVSLAFERPESVDALLESVARHVAESHAIYPQGGRTALEYGGVPARPGVAIDTTALTRVIEYPAADMTITVEAGITIAALAAILKAKGQRLTIDVPHPDQATLGGVYATNCSGPRRFGAGRPRDQIIGVSFATSEGKLVKGGGRVVKNVAGYDFPKLLTGSMGCLGILTQLSVKVRPIPESSALVVIPLGSLDDAEKALATLNVSVTRPIAVELLNHEAAAITGVDLPASDWVLVVGYEDNPTSVDWQLDRIPGELGVARNSIALFRDAEASPLWDRLTGFQEETPGAFSVVANVKPSTVASFCRLLAETPHAIQSHAGNGIVRAHGLEDCPREGAGSRLDRLRAEAVRRGGNLVITRRPIEWKSDLPIWGRPGGDWPVMERVRKALDPTGSMNPGRFLGMM